MLFFSCPNLLQIQTKFDNIIKVSKHNERIKIKWKKELIKQIII